MTRPADCGRLLLGELAIETDAPADAAAELPRPGRLATTPHRVKSVLDRELLDAGVQFLHGCYATDTLVDEDGRPAGIVMANRAGRQAVVAKVIIDATDRATVARLAGAEQRPWPDGPVEFERVVLLKGTAGKTRAVHHRLRLPMPDGSYRSFARAEQDARDRDVPGWPAPRVGIAVLRTARSDRYSKARRRRPGQMDRAFPARGRLASLRALRLRRCAAQRSGRTPASAGAGGDGPADRCQGGRGGFGPAGAAAACESAHAM